MSHELGSNLADERSLQVIARSLAYMCLHSANMAERTLAEKARLLEALGLSRGESAQMLGTSYNSLTELMRVARKAKQRGKGDRNGRKAKGR